MSVPERRKSPRYHFTAGVEIEWGSQLLKVSSSDISRGGMFVLTGAPLWVGAEFAARVLLEEPLQVDCVVRRVVPGEGMGVQFLRLANSSQARLGKLLETLAGQ